MEFTRNICTFRNQYEWLEILFPLQIRSIRNARAEYTVEPARRISAVIVASAAYQATVEVFLEPLNPKSETLNKIHTNSFFCVASLVGSYISNFHLGNIQFVVWVLFICRKFLRIWFCYAGGGSCPCCSFKAGPWQSKNTLHSSRYNFKISENIKPQDEQSMSRHLEEFDVVLVSAQLRRMAEL